jgi:hypothetical protein
VTDAWVINASPIILYGRIGRIDVIERLAPSVIVPTIEIPSSIERWDLGQGYLIGWSNPENLFEQQK